jgi:hypothetical protein
MRSSSRDRNPPGSTDRLSYHILRLRKSWLVICAPRSTEAADRAEATFRGDAELLRLPLGTLAARPHEQPFERILREIMRRARVVGAFDLFQTPNLGYFQPPSSNSSIYVAHPDAPTVAVDNRYHIYAGFVGCPKSLVQARAAALAAPGPSAVRTSTAWDFRAIEMVVLWLLIRHPTFEPTL